MAGALPPLVGKLSKMFLSFIAAIVIVIALTLFAITTPFFAAKLGGWLTSSSGRNVSLEGHLEAHVWQSQPRFILTGVKVGNAEWGSQDTMFSADRIELSINPWALLKAQLVLPTLMFDKPMLLLEKNMQGEGNWSFSSNPQAEALKGPVPQNRFDMPIIHHLRIADGKITYRDPKKKIDTTVAVSTVQGESDQVDETIHVQGKGNYQSKPFLLDLTGASILQLRDNDEPYPFALQTIIGDTKALVKGTVQDPVKLEALDVQLNLKGKNAADLFPITGIALPPTPPYQVSGHLTREKEDWHFEKFAGSMGSSDLKGDIVWHAGQKPPYFEGDFRSDNLDMKDLSGLIGAKDKPVDDTRVIPDTPLDITRMMAMNADVTFHGERVKQPTILDDFYMKLHLKDGVLKIEPVSFGIDKGNIETNITIEGRKTPPLATMKVKFNHLSLRRFFKPLAEKFGERNVTIGMLGGGAELKGHGKSLREILGSSNGDIGLGMEGGQLSKLLLSLAGLDLFRSAGLLLSGRDQPVDIHCVVAHFDVEDGYMGIESFLVDTDIIAINAEGGADLKNETLDMRLTTSPKEASPLSAHSPIMVSGTFKHPKVGLDTAALVARGGAATALAFIAPPAALLAFIQPGLGKDSNCAAFIQRAK